jgi:hypothetical protein
MGSERRRDIRTESSAKVVIKRKSDDNFEVFPLYLRDVSESGLSGTFFGTQRPRPHENLFIESPDGLRPVRLVWSYSTLETVHMLGFELKQCVGCS